MHISRYSYENSLTSKCSKCSMTQGETSRSHVHSLTGGRRVSDTNRPLFSTTTMFCYSSAMINWPQCDAQQDKGLTLIGIVFNFHLHLPRVRLQRHQPTLEVLLLTILGVFQGDVPLQGERVEKHRVGYGEPRKGRALIEQLKSAGATEQARAASQLNAPAAVTARFEPSRPGVVCLLSVQSFVSSWSRLGHRVAGKTHLLHVHHPCPSPGAL